LAKTLNVLRIVAESSGYGEWYAPKTQHIDSEWGKLKMKVAT